MMLVQKYEIISLPAYIEFSFFNIKTELEQRNGDEATSALTSLLMLTKKTMKKRCFQDSGLAH